MSQLTHNVFKTFLESCAELVWDKRCSNLVATFDQIYLCGNENELYQTLLQRCSNVIWQHTMLQQRYLATFPSLLLKVVTQRCGNGHVTFLDYVFTTFTNINVVETLLQP